jgi:hypothetical protein
MGDRSFWGKFMTSINSYFLQTTALQSLTMLFGITGSDAAVKPEPSGVIPTVSPVNDLWRSATATIVSTFNGSAGETELAVSLTDIVMDNGAARHRSMSIDYEAGSTGLHLSVVEMSASDGRFSRLTNVHGGAGDDVVNIKSSLNGMSHVDGGDGEDVIDVVSRDFTVINGGSGDDIISADTLLANIRGGDGDDVVKITANNSAMVLGDAGNDTLDITAGNVGWADGGEGDDTLHINSRTEVTTVWGGAGDDVLSIRAVGHVKDVDGDSGKGVDGNDVITIEADRVSNIYGGGGDDVIAIEARRGENIRGGAGDDTIKLVGAERAALEFGKGDGNDHVSISGETVLSFHGRSADDAIISYGESSFTITFKDSTDSVTIDYSKATLSGPVPRLESSGINLAETRPGAMEDLARRLGNNKAPSHVLAVSTLSGSGGFQLRIS